MSTPNDVEILIHYCCRVAPHPRLDAPAVRETIDQFIADGILCERGPCFDNPLSQRPSFIATAKGRAWLAAICRVPYPQQQWVDEQGRVLEW